MILHAIQQTRILVLSVTYLFLQHLLINNISYNVYIYQQEFKTTLVAFVLSFSEMTTMIFLMMTYQPAALVGARISAMTPMMNLHRRKNRIPTERDLEENGPIPGRLT